MMTNTGVKLLLGSMIFLGASAAAQDESKEMTLSSFQLQAQQKAMVLGKELKSTLQQTVKHGGLTAGVLVCKQVAPTIAQGLSEQGWTVARTALKVRNPDNQADAWETAQLQAFAQALADGMAPQSLQVTAYDETSRTYRYMSPIMTAGLCVNCHGAKIAPEVAEVINNQYPNDQATGFSEGQLRGAFTLTYQAPDNE
jgi:hypothetical protein